MKIIAWNVQTVAKRLAELGGVVRSFGDADVVCLQELGIRARDPAEVAALEAALPDYTCHHALPRDPWNVRFRGGRAYGVATFVRAALGATASVPAWDREGRVVVTRVGGLAIVNLYAVNGTAKPYLDEQGAPAGDRHAFKRRFQRQLVESAAALAPGVILAGDWNVTPTALDTHPRLRTEGPHARARAELAAHLAAHGFVDIWRQLHPEERAYSWFDTRSRTLDAARVDYIVVSQDLVPRVTSAAILSRHPWSDHAPLALELAA